MSRKKCILIVAFALFFSTIYHLNYVNADSGWDSSYDSSSTTTPSTEFNSSSTSLGGINITKEEIIPCLFIEVFLIGIIIGVSYVRISKIKMIVITSISSVMYIISHIYFYLNYTSPIHKLIPLEIIIATIMIYYNLKHWNHKK